MILLKNVLGPKLQEDKHDVKQEVLDVVVPVDEPLKEVPAENQNEEIETSQSIKEGN